MVRVKPLIKAVSEAGMPAVAVHRSVEPVLPGEVLQRCSGSRHQANQWGGLVGVSSRPKPGTRQDGAAVHERGRFKFRTESLKIPYLLHHTVEEYLINAMKNMVWHRFNDIDVSFKNVIAIKINISTTLLEILNIRHHIIHRNSYDLEGNKVVIEDQDLQNCIALVNSFVFEIDKKYQAQR